MTLPLSALSISSILQRITEGNADGEWLMHMDCRDLPYVVEPMQLADVPTVASIERDVFPMPWAASAFAYEVQANPHSYYLVARYRQLSAAPSFQGKLTSALHRLAGRRRNTEILGYAGFWLMASQAHISTLAVTPRHLRRGIGELLLVGLIDWACEVRATTITLEVRTSNLVAQSLYRKYGFETTDVRKGYYSDNGEDALVMNTKTITSASFQSNFQHLRDELRTRLRSSRSARVGSWND